MMRVLSKQILSGALRKLGYELHRARPTSQVIDVPLIDVFELVLRDYLKHNPSPFLVQVGAHDGQTDDPVGHLVRRHGLRALLVEPQPIAYRRLVEYYRGQPQLLFESSLVAAQDGEVRFYKAREDMPGLPAALLQSASMDRKRVEAAVGWYRADNPQLDVRADDLIEEVTVRSLSWESLLAKHRVSTIDILVIDTMGLDYELLKVFPFERMKPEIIHFEHHLLSPEDQMACVELLIRHGYSMAKVAVDTIAVRKAKTRRWMLNGWAAAAVGTAAEVALESLDLGPGLLGALA